MRARFISLHLDVFGFFASILCALHCLALPFLFLLLPHLPVELLHQPFVEYVLFTISFLVAAFSLWSSYRKHRRFGIPLLMLLSFLLLISGIAFASTTLLEAVLTSSGGLLLAIAHYANWNYAHRQMPLV